MTYDSSDDDPTFKGTYRGISGTFECTAGTCTVSLNDDGEAEVGATDALSFVPDSIASTYDDPDAAYVNFGWWKETPEEADGDYGVNVFAHGVGDNAADVTTAVEGTARYVGPAAGLYAVQTYTAGVQSEGENGDFTATADLTADFGADDEEGFTIDGTVTDFTVSGGVNSGAWKVTLDPVTGSNGDAHFGGTTKVTFGGAEDGSAGHWQGRFYDGEAGEQPGTVAGVFDASTGGASLIGAFGATKQE